MQCVVHLTAGGWTPTKAEEVSSGKATSGVPRLCGNNHRNCSGSQESDGSKSVCCAGGPQNPSFFGLG